MKVILAVGCIVVALSYAFEAQEYLKQRRFVEYGLAMLASFGAVFLAVWACL